jgi:tetratricopeptide (TPR) repeat protein
MANRAGRPISSPGDGVKSPDSAVQRALLALNDGRANEALRIAAEILEAQPSHGQALRICGYALLMLGRPHDVVARLEPAARGCQDPEIETQLAIALRQVGRAQDALSSLKRATKRRPPFAAAFHELGFLLISMEHYDEAIEVLRRGLEAAPMMPELSITLGTVFLQRRNFADAQRAFARALAISPEFPDALYGIAMAYLQGGEHRAAAEYFRRCLRTVPNDASVWLKLGQCLLELRERATAYECFRAAARGDPKRYGNALAALVKSARGRFWLKPSAAAQFLRNESR